MIGADLGSAGAEQLEHLAVVGEAPELLLREDRLAVRDDVVLALGALARGRVESALGQLGRETRSPSVVPASDGAVEDLDGHAEIVRARVEPALQVHS
jgi:hypothetical protein